MQPPEASRPVRAQFVLATGTLTVDFDKLLVTGVTARSQWIVFDGLFRHLIPAGPGTVFMRTVTMDLPAVIPDLTAVGVDYSALFADVISRNGLPVAAFSGFPITII